jgi:hypothetical protein
MLEHVSISSSCVMMSSLSHPACCTGQSDAARNLTAAFKQGDDGDASTPATQKVCT